MEKAEVEFASGLNVITGETGAGKSVLLGALELVLGGRADSTVVREGAKEAEIEAVIGGRSLRRTVTSEGRSRAWLNDESVTIAELKEFAAKTVDIHGPRANQRLLEEDFQRQCLDEVAFGGKIPVGYCEAFSAYRKLADEIAALEKEGADEDEIELLRYQVNELESAALTEEDESLAERHAAAAHAGEILQNANAVTEALGGERGAAEILITLQSRLAIMAKHLPTATEWATRIESLTLDLQELSRTVADAVSDLGDSEENLDDLDARLTLVNRLKRKYLKGGAVEGESAIAALLKLVTVKREKLDRLEHRGERLKELRVQLSAAEKTLIAEGAKVTKKRRAAAEKCAQAIMKELKDLGFKTAKFSIALEPSVPSATGCDRVIYLFEPNPGETARPLAAIASSGEIARVMLALKTVLAGTEGVGTLIFDEIDANIGGEVGRVVGEKLRRVAKGPQVIAITHLPQSAVFGERHLVVRKTVEGGRARTTISPVTGAERVAEIARMLGGEELTSVVKKHAQELVELSR